MRERDLSEHGRVLKLELESVTKELHTNAEKNTILKNQNDSLVVENKRIVEENKELIKRNLELDKLIYEKTKEIESKEQQFKESCDKKEAQIKGVEQDSRSKVLNLKSKIDALSQVLFELNSKVENNLKLISFQEQEIKNNGLTLDTIHGKIQDAGSELRALRLGTEKERGDIQKLIIASNQELIDVRLLIEDEKRKISMPMELLRKANQEINTKKADLDIYKNQLDDHWEDILKRRKL